MGKQDVKFFFSLDRTKKLIKTIDKTILHIRGKTMIEDKEIYHGFNEWSKNKGPESFAILSLKDADSEAEKILTVGDAVKFIESKSN